jgi:hypothetical protein
MKLTLLHDLPFSAFKLFTGFTTATLMISRVITANAISTVAAMGTRNIFQPS